MHPKLSNGSVGGTKGSFGVSGDHVSERRVVRKRLWAVGGILCAGSLTLAACGTSSSNASPNQSSSTTVPNATSTSGSSTPVRGGTIVTAIDSDPPTLDWTYSTSTVTYEVAWNIFEQLFALDAHSQPKPMLASGYTVGSKGLHYKIQLRHGITFQNGQALTSADVVASIGRWEKVSSVGQTVAEHVKSVAADGTYAVEITLYSAFSPLIADLATVAQACIIIPASIAQAAGTSPLTNAQSIGTGPYKLKKWVRGQYIELSRWSGYKALPKADDWGGIAGHKAAYAADLKYDIVPSASTRLSGLESGQFQLADTLTAQDYPEIKGNSSIKPVLVPYSNQLMIVFNKKKGPFVSQSMREAINLVSNKRDILAAAFGPKRFWSMGDSLFFPNQGSLYTTVGDTAYKAYDPSRAKALMRSAGYKFSRPIRILVTQTYPYMYNAGVALAAELQQIGVKTKVLTYDWPTDLADRKNPNAWDLFITGFAPLFDPSQLLWILPSYNGWYNSPKMQKLLSDWDKASTPSTKKTVLDEIQRLQWSQLPIVKLGNQNGLEGAASKLHGFGTLAGSDVLWNASLSK